jgi:hypothetical protein
MKSMNQVKCDRQATQLEFERLAKEYTLACKEAQKIYLRMESSRSDILSYDSILKTYENYAIYMK